MRNWLILDVDYLAYRAAYSTGSLMLGKVYTGVLFGVFRDINSLRTQFNTEDFVFCFDHGRSKRLELWPHYKEHRKRPPHPDRAALLRSLPKQTELLRCSILHEIGFRNVYFQDGYEADDTVASVVQNLVVNERAIIISADSDLFQLLEQDKVCIYKPREKEFITEETFSDKWGLHPRKWIDVKSISGCLSDNVPGVPGVKELTAAKYVRGELSKTTATYSAIEQWVGSEDWQRSRQLVSLPYPETNVYKPEAHKPVSDRAWDKAMRKLGIEVLKRDSHNIRNHIKIDKP